MFFFSSSSSLRINNLTSNCLNQIIHIIFTGSYFELFQFIHLYASYALKLVNFMFFGW